MIPAVITVIGVGFTGCVTLVGLLFKRSVDNRTVAISERNEQTRFAEQRRLQMDAANRAVQLLSLPDGRPAPTVQSSSAILVLAELGETQFAFTLVQELWPKKQISTSAAVRVINDALSLDASFQRSAANLLRMNVAQLDVDHSQSEWPARLETWDTSLDLQCRYAVALALLSWLTLKEAKSADDWRLKLLRQARMQEIDSQFETLGLPPAA